MTPEKHPVYHHYDYQQLDNFLTYDYDPLELSNRFDWIRDTLIAHVEKDEFYRENIVEDTFIMGFFRDFLKDLKPLQP